MNIGAKEQLIVQYFRESTAIQADLEKYSAKVMRMADGIHRACLSGNKILVAGNGGSCADAEHFVGELTCTYKSRLRRPYAAISLTNSSSAITAWTNDFGFDSYFTRQVEALGTTGDILFLISTGGGDRSSGASMNLVHAAEKAGQMGIDRYALVGKTGGELSSIAEEHINVNSFTTSHIQEAHISILHAICEWLDTISAST